jgi:hypothetical protein
MFGNDMIVAPIGTKSDHNMSIKKLWLPQGDWYELYTGSMLKGQQEYIRSYHLHEVPVFVKAGTIIPMYPKTIKNLQELSDTLIFSFIPGPSSSLKMYEDDGNSSDYKMNRCAYTTVKKELQENGILKINILPTEGSYSGMKTKLHYELSFPSSFPPQKVLVNKKEYSFNNEPKEGSWTYDAEKLSVRILIPETSRKENIEVTLIPDPKTKDQEAHLWGKIGIIARSPFIIEKMKYALNTVDPFANLTNNITKIGSLKANIQYNPSNCLGILSHYDTNFNQLIADIKNYTKINESDLNEVLKLFVYDVKMISKPTIQLEASASDRPVTVKMTSDEPGSKIYYTTDRSMPTENSIPYNAEFLLGKTAEIKAKCFKDNSMYSEVSSCHFQRTLAKSVKFARPYHPKYDGGNVLAFVDGVFGTEKDFVNKWIGFESSDMIATVELKSPTKLKSITARFLESNSQWIFAPLEVSYEVSTDGMQFRKVFYVDRKDQSKSFTKKDCIISISAEIDENDVKFIRITAKNMGICPSWHYGAGGAAWLFTDELLVE